MQTISLHMYVYYVPYCQHINVDIKEKASGLTNGFSEIFPHAFYYGMASMLFFSYKACNKQMH